MKLPKKKKSKTPQEYNKNRKCSKISPPKTPSLEGQNNFQKTVAVKKLSPSKIFWISKIPQQKREIKALIKSWIPLPNKNTPPKNSPLKWLTLLEVFKVGGGGLEGKEFVDFSGVFSYGDFQLLDLFQREVLS